VTGRNADLIGCIARAIHRYDHEHDLSRNDIPSDHHRGEAAAVLDALQGLYVPPPPGSDRDALPEHLRALIAPHMRPYVSTACETALACDRASTIHHAQMATFADWEQRQHAACRITRKQDMAACQCDCHTTAKED
jgi:hypothetical protein